MNYQPRELAMAIIEQAVQDYRELVAARAIINGRVRSRWGTETWHGRTRNKSYLNYYNHPNLVTDLIDFFKSEELDKLLSACELKFTATQIRRKLGI